VPRSLRLRTTDWSQSESVEESSHMCLLAFTQPSDDLLDVDGRHAGNVVAGGA
jgi:hypothetical protein